MKLIVFGASRGTGLHAVKLAIDNGHEVTAVARSIPAVDAGQSSGEKNTNLKTVQGDVLQPSTFEHELEGKDVVISFISVPDNKPTTLFSEGVANIMSAMTKHNVARLICVSGLGVELTPGMSYPMKLATRFIVQPMFRNIFSNLLEMENAVRQSPLDWTIIRAPRLINGTLTGEYRFVADGHLRNPISLRRADLAHFIISNLDNHKLHRSRVEVAN